MTAIYGGASLFSGSCNPSAQSCNGTAGTNSSSAAPGNPSQGSSSLAERIGPAYTLDLASQKTNDQDPEVRQLKRSGKIACKTCQQRKYQDGSNDPGVSFKAPGHIAPEASGSVVQAHEQEHVSHEQAKARQEGRKVVAQSVRVFTSVCPECGRVYISGGETSTTTVSDDKKQQKDKEQTLGSHVDMVA